MSAPATPPSVPAPAPDPAPTRAEVIVEQLRDQIINGKYEAGERLPSERDLAERLGVNRGSVREALKKLEQMGMITIRRGGGARVVPIEEHGLGALPHMLSADQPDRDLVAQWLDVWELLLAGSARLAVERGSAEEFAEVQRLLTRFMDPDTTDDEYVALSDDITEIIAVASRNVVLRMVRNGLTHQMNSRRGLRLQIRPAQKFFTPIMREISKAIDRRDAAAVEEGVRQLVRLGRGPTIDAVAGPDTQAQ